MQEDQAIGRIVEVIWNGKRYIRKCVQGQKEHHWIFAPLDDSFPFFTSTPYNIKETEIIGSLRFIMRFGGGVDPSRLLDAGEFAKLQVITEFRRVKKI